MKTAHKVWYRHKAWGGHQHIQVTGRADRISKGILLRAPRPSTALVLELRAKGTICQFPPDRHMFVVQKAHFGSFSAATVSEQISFQTDSF